MALETRIVNIRPPAYDGGLYIITYQHYSGDRAVGEAWEAHIPPIEYEVMKIKYRIMNKYGIPEKDMDEFAEAVRDQCNKDRDELERYQDEMSSF